LEVLPQGHAITADTYCQQLDCLVAAIQQKRRWLMGGGAQQITYLYDNTRPHTANKTVNELQEIGFNVLPQTSYSPNLAPFDFYLFSPIKTAL